MILVGLTRMATRDIPGISSRNSPSCFVTNSVSAETTLRAAEDAANAAGLHMQVFNASTSRDINAVFTSFGRERPDAIFVGGDGLF